MKAKIFLVVLAFVLSGCSQLYNSNEVNIDNTDEVLTYQTGTVQDIKKVIIKDDGSGVMVGAMSGTVLGSMVGNGKGNLLSTLIGGLTGALAGYEADKANGEEVFVRLDNGKNIAIIVKGVDIQKGDRVRIIKNGSRIVRVERI